MKSFIIVSEKDNVATALRNFKKGEEVANIRLKNDIASGHKFALKILKPMKQLLNMQRLLRV